MFLLLGYRVCSISGHSFLGVSFLIREASHHPLGGLRLGGTFPLNLGWPFGLYGLAHLGLGISSQDMKKSSKGQGEPFISSGRHGSWECPAPRGQRAHGFEFPGTRPEGQPRPVRRHPVLFGSKSLLLWEYEMKCKEQLNVCHVLTFCWVAN